MHADVSRFTSDWTMTCSKNHQHWRQQKDTKEMREKKKKLIEEIKVNETMPKIIQSKYLIS